jgi:hypothetical protein
VCLQKIKGKIMHHIYILTIISVLLSASSVSAQESSAKGQSPCVVVPIFHCAQHLEGGSVIGHFGYELRCPKDAGTEEEVYIDINDNNLFSPDPKDRGQPKIFLSGEHVDEFEVDFSMVEVKGDSVIQWSVIDKTAMVDFSKTKDQSLDCSVLSE